MDAERTILERPSDREVVLKRRVGAPPELVWKAWTEVEHVGRWWGPDGFTTTTREMNVQPGGLWIFTMHGPDGTDYPNKITYLEVEAPSRLVYKHGGEKEFEPVNFEVETTFKPESESTLITMRMRFPSASALEHVIENYGALEGGRQTLARLDDYLADEISTEQE